MLFVLYISNPFRLFPVASFSFCNPLFLLLLYFFGFCNPFSLLLLSFFNLCNPFPLLLLLFFNFGDAVGLNLQFLFRFGNFSFLLLVPLSFLLFTCFVVGKFKFFSSYGRRGWRFSFFAVFRCHGLGTFFNIVL